MAKRGCPRDRPAPKIRGADDVVRLLRSLLCDDCLRGEVALAIDWDMRPVGFGFRAGDTRHPPLDAVQIVLLAEKFGACEVAVVTFVEPDRLTPTPADVARYEGWRVECLQDGIELLDHVLISSHHWRSIRELSAAPGA